MGEKCSVRYTLKDDSERFFNGTLVDAQWLGVRDGYYTYRFTLKPWLWLLSQRSDCRIFKKMTAIEIIQKIFQKEDSATVKDRTSEKLQPIEYCVQYRETDLNFVLRLMEQYGIYYYFNHSDSDHELVLCDSRSGHDLVNASAEQKYTGNRSVFAYLGRGRLARTEVEHLTQWSTVRRLRTGKFELKDYDYDKSGSDLTARAEEGYPKTKSYESFDYPATYTKRDQGEHFARVRAQAEQAKDDRRFTGGDAPSLHAGALLKLAEHPTDAENVEYLVVRAAHNFGGESYRSGDESGEAYYNDSFELQKSDRRFRAPLVTERAKVHGPHTAKVVGENNEGEEGDIDVDKYGCIWLRFHWDREDRSTSCRTRVAQMWAGKNWGGQIIPRIGQEVIVEYLEGNPDLPMVVGAVVNDQHKPPYDLPANKTQSGLKSESTDQAGFSGTFNEIKFEDLKGKEVFEMNAEKDHKVRVYNIETRELGERFEGSEYSRETTLKLGSDKLDIQNGKLDVEALKEINFKVGESTIKMTPGSIEIKSPTITIHSQAQTEVKSDGLVIVNAPMVKIN